MNISRDKGRVRNLVKRPESRADGYRALRAMSFIKQVRTYFQPPVSEVVLGMVIDIKVVTDEPGYDFRILVHHMTKDENIVSKHYVLIAANGQTMDDVKRDIFGKFILLAVDEHGHGTPPEKGRLQWNSERNVFISPYSDFEIKCKQASGESEFIGVFNQAQRRKYTLPMPPKGWHCTTVTFINKSGHSYKFLFDGTKE